MDELRLNLGSGKCELDGFVNVDWVSSSSRTVVHDLNKFPYPFTDSSVHFILMDNVLEHLDRVDLVMRELYRIGCDGCRVRILVPYYNSKCAVADVTHTHYFSENTLEQFCSNTRSNILCQNLFVVERIILVPSKFGVLFPKFIRRQVSNVLGSVIDSIIFEFRVIKDEAV